MRLSLNQVSSEWQMIIDPKPYDHVMFKNVLFLPYFHLTLYIVHDRDDFHALLKDLDPYICIFLGKYTHQQSHYGLFRINAVFKKCLLIFFWISADHIDIFTVCRQQKETYRQCRRQYLVKAPVTRQDETQCLQFFPAAFQFYF